MTKKDYELIAKCLWISERDKTFTAGQIQELIAVRFADNLQEQNPRFNRSKFLLACGITE